MPETGTRRTLALALGLAAVTALLHVATIRGYGYFRDELYYIACARHLGFGYVDHPPLTELLLRATMAGLGTSLPAIRLLPALAAAATVLLAGMLVGELGGRHLAVVTAAIAVALAPVLVGISSIFTPNVFDVLLWTLASLVLVRLLRTGEPRLWPIVGVVVGLGLETKHTTAFFVAGLGVGLVVTRARRHLASPLFWAGAAIACLLFLPNLAWEIRNGVPTLEFLRNAVAYKNVARGPFAFVAEQVLILDPLAAPLWLAGLGFLIVARDGAPYRALGVTYLAVLALFIAGGGKSYYLAGIYPLLLAAGAVVVERRLRPGIARALAAALAVAGLALAPLAKPLLPVEAFPGYARAFGRASKAGVDERTDSGVLPQVFADEHGWPEMVRTIATAWERLPAEDRERACIVASNYGEAGAVDFFGPPLGLPPALSPHDSYWLWGRHGCELDPVIAVGPTRADLARFYDRVEEVTIFRCAYCMPFEAQLAIWIARGRKLPPDEMWTRVKRFM